MNTYGPYSPFRVANGFVYTAGQIGAVKGKADANVKVQVRQALDNLKSVLHEAGTDMGSVVKTTVYITDMKHYADMNEVYAEVFGAVDNAPARSCVAVAELPRVADVKLLVEVEAVALLRENT
ncbi:RidA family protein [Candidatus Saccharibacteria bacterium]|nr:RidA family protein [Candidatus Saccharibacteria bacterium]